MAARRPGRRRICSSFPSFSPRLARSCRCRFSSSRWRTSAISSGNNLLAEFWHLIQEGPRGPPHQGDARGGRQAQPRVGDGVRGEPHPQPPPREQSAPPRRGADGRHARPRDGRARLRAPVPQAQALGIPGSYSKLRICRELRRRARRAPGSSRSRANARRPPCSARCSTRASTSSATGIPRRSPRRTSCAATRKRRPGPTLPSARPCAPSATPWRRFRDHPARASPPPSTTSSPNACRPVDASSSRAAATSPSSPSRRSSRRATRRFSSWALRVASGAPRGNISWTPRWNRIRRSAPGRGGVAGRFSERGGARGGGTVRGDLMEKCQLVLCTIASTSRLLREWEEHVKQPLRVHTVVVDECGCTRVVDGAAAQPSTAESRLTGRSQPASAVFARAPQALKGTGHDRSMLERCVLASGGRVHRLTEQYRMHPRICKAVSRRFYQDQLDTAPATAEERCAHAEACGEPDAMVWVQVHGQESVPADGKSYVNRAEVDAVVAPRPGSANVTDRTPQSQRSPSTRDNTWRFSRRCRRRSRWSA